MSGKLEISWFSALCDDDYEFLGQPDPMLASSWEHCRNIVLNAEKGGFDNILLPSGYALGLDTTAFASAIAVLTSRIKLLMAVRVGESWPPQLARQIATLAQFSSVPVVSTQPELSPLRIDTIENGELDQAIAMDMTVLAWSPLGGGRIADPQSQREQAVAAALSGVAAAHGVSRTAAAYSWIMAHPARPVPIVGSQNPARIAEAADAYKIQWTRADWYAVLVAARGVPLP